MSVEPAAKVEPAARPESLPLVEDSKPSPLATSPSAAPSAARAERQRVLSERVQSLRMPETGVTRRSRKHVLPWMLCGVLLLVTFWRGGLALNAVPASAPADADDSTEVGQSATSSAAATPSASGGAVAANGRRVVLESKGYIIAAHQILVSPKVSGTVTRLTFEEGKRVKKGDILAEIEDIDYRTDYEHCVGECELARQKLLELERGNRPEEIAQAKAQLQESEANLTQLEADWKRIQKLREATTSPLPPISTRPEASIGRWCGRSNGSGLPITLMLIGSRKEKIDAGRKPTCKRRSRTSRRRNGSSTTAKFAHPSPARF